MTKQQNPTAKGNAMLKATITVGNRTYVREFSHLGHLQAYSAALVAKSGKKVSVKL